MEEDGLGAIRDVILNIDDQDQKVWRQNASRKYWKEEIKQLEEQTKPYEVQIEKLKPDAPYRSTEGITQLLEDETKHQVQVYHLLQNLTSAKQSEIEMARREMKSWDENYREVVSEFERVLEQRKSFYEATNHYYKKLRQCETANKLTLVEQNMWKAQVFSKTKSLEQLKNIKKQIMQKTIVKFAAANIRIKKNDSLNSLLTKAADKKKELVGILFEVQETLKKKNFNNNQRTSTSIFSNLLSSSCPLRKDAGITKKKVQEYAAESSKLQLQPVDFRTFDPISTGSKTHYSEPTTENENISASPSKDSTKQTTSYIPKKINVLSNKVITLPSLKSIVGGSKSRHNLSNRSFLDTTFNKSLTVEGSSQNSQKMKQTSSQEKGSMVEMEFKRPVNDSSTAANASKPELLKNSNVVVQAPQKISVEVHSQNSQGDSTNQLVDKSLKSQSIPILRTQSLKRKMNDSLNASMTALKQDKKVNFAFPQGEKGRSENSDVHNIIPIVSETVRDVDMKDAKEGDTNISGYTEVEYPNFASPQFDITFTGNQDADDNLFVSDPDKNQSNFFPNSQIGESSFGFNFGGASKPGNNALWDMFG